MNRTVLLIGLMVTAPLVWILASGFGNDPHTIDSPLVGRKAPTFCAPAGSTGASGRAQGHQPTGGR